MAYWVDLEVWLTVDSHMTSGRGAPSSTGYQINDGRFNQVWAVAEGPVVLKLTRACRLIRAAPSAMAARHERSLRHRQAPYTMFTLFSWGFAHLRRNIVTFYGLIWPNGTPWEYRLL